MMKIIIALAFIIAVATATNEHIYRETFVSWMQEHGRQYERHEFASRFATFKKNMDFVNQWNSKNSETVLGLTVFADHTNEEYQKIYLGTRVNVADTLIQSVTDNLDSVFALPASVDWRQKGAVTPIKNQGQCGSCWSFSTTGSTEGAHQISTGNLVALSEQNLIDCSSSFGNQGCNGGMMPNAFEYIISNNGIDTESSYPYTAAEGPKCKFNKDNIGATISSYVNVTSTSENALALQVLKGPVSVAIDASHNSFQLYSKGVYYEPKCSSTALDHGVLVVGFGTTTSSSGSAASASSSGSSSSTTSSSSSSSSGSGSGSGSSGTTSDVASFTASGTAYWTVKNSWGTSWGINGYILMSRNRNNNCGIATMASQPSV